MSMTTVWIDSRPILVTNDTSQITQNGDKTFFNTYKMIQYEYFVSASLSQRLGQGDLMAGVTRYVGRESFGHVFMHTSPD